MYGCVASLAVWFLEHTRVRQPINRMAYPRLFRWGTFAGKTSPFPIASLTGQQVIKNLTVERNEMETIYKGNQTVPEDTSMVPPTASLSLLQEIAASIKSQEVKFDQLNTQLNDQMRQIEEIMRYIHRRDEPATEEPVTAKWVCKGQLKEKHNAIVESFLETCGSVGSEPDFGIFEFANSLVIRKSHILNLLYGCMTEDTATTVRRMLKEYGAFPDAAKWELRFDNQCPQQVSGSLNCAIYVVKYIEALIRRKFPGWTFNEDDCNLFRAKFAALLLELKNQ
ncbi:hypothetical protein Taro_049356 [Colocasia esculenta]|uniref:Ubiquitin-like protease family profile domain-containing protein n=1 Tax=Colocasia esculenta TaxID=4460 RepID=A0A843XAR1_COLES|nr:hypothetical protein [Colocasia esculenta]